MATRRAQPDEPSGWLFGVLEKHGISAFLLIAGAWWLGEQVGKPLVASTTQFVSDIRECNEIIQTELMQQQAESLERYKQIHELMTIKRELIQRALDELDHLKDSNEKVSSEIAQLRMLLIRSPVEGLQRGNNQTNNQ